jgi:small multidrug resistance pump
VKKWLLLGAAIVSEVAGTIALRATVEQPVWILVVVVAYVSAFGLFGLALRQGMPVGEAYGIWGASGVAFVAILGTVIFDEVLSPLGIAGLLLILSGVALVETGSPSEVAESE